MSAGSAQRPRHRAPPWEIRQPQPAIVELARQSAVTGRVLDVGCGTGEHTLLAASLGLDATGVDLDEHALDAARTKAARRGLTARFLRHDALRLSELGERFDTALDSLVLHALGPADRHAYVVGLRQVQRPGGRLLVLCYSDRYTAEPLVPHALARDEIATILRDGWLVDAIDPATSASNVHLDGVAAWLVTSTRT